MQKIGHRAPKIETLPSSSVLQTQKSPMMPSNSANIGGQAMQKAQTKLTGREPTAITSEFLGQALSAADPVATDRDLTAYLQRSLGLRLEWKTVWINGEPETVAAQAMMPDDPVKRTAALDAIKQAMEPLSTTEALKLLAQVRLQTISRPAESADLEALGMMMAQRLMGYPADVVRHVLQTQPDVSKWWPTWAELRERLDLHSRRRKSIAAAARSIRADDTEPKKTRITPAQLAELMAKVRGANRTTPPISCRADQTGL